MRASVLVDLFSEERDVLAVVEHLTPPHPVHVLARAEPSHDLGHRREAPLRGVHIVVAPAAFGDGAQFVDETLDRLTSTQFDAQPQPTVVVEGRAPQRRVDWGDALFDLLRCAEDVADELTDQVSGSFAQEPKERGLVVRQAVGHDGVENRDVAGAVFHVGSQVDGRRLPLAAELCGQARDRPGGGGCGTLSGIAFILEAAEHFVGDIGDRAPGDGAFHRAEALVEEVPRGFVDIRYRT